MFVGEASFVSYDRSDFEPSAASMWTLGAALKEMDLLRSTLIEVGATAAMCQHEMRGRLLDDEHKRAFRALEKIKGMCRS